MGRQSRIQSSLISDGRVLRNLIPRPVYLMYSRWKRNWSAVDIVSAPSSSHLACDLCHDGAHASTISSSYFYFAVNARWAISFNSEDRFQQYQLPCSRSSSLQQFEPERASRNSLVSGCLDSRIKEVLNTHPFKGFEPNQKPRCL